MNTNKTAQEVINAATHYDLLRVPVNGKINPIGLSSVAGSVTVYENGTALISVTGFPKFTRTENIEQFKLLAFQTLNNATKV